MSTKLRLTKAIFMKCLELKQLRLKRPDWNIWDCNFWDWNIWNWKIWDWKVLDWKISDWKDLIETLALNRDQARKQSGQTKPMCLGSCQCFATKFEISDCNEFGFFGQLLDVYRKIFLTSLITSQNKSIRFCFFHYPPATIIGLDYF